MCKGCRIRNIIVKKEPYIRHETDYNNILAKACRNNDIKVVESIMNKESVDLGYALKNACYNGHIEIIKLFLTYKPNYDILHDSLANAIYNGDISIVKYMLENTTIDDGYYKCRIFYLCMLWRTSRNDKIYIK